RSAGAAAPSPKQRPEALHGKGPAGRGEPGPRTAAGTQEGLPAPPAPAPDGDPGPGTREDLGPARGCREADRPPPRGRSFRPSLRDLRRGSARAPQGSACPGGRSRGAAPGRTRQRPVTPAAPRCRRAAGLGEPDPGARLAALGLRWGVDSLEGCSWAGRRPRWAASPPHLPARAPLAPRAGASGRAGQLPRGGSAAWEQQGRDRQGCTALHVAAVYLGDGEAASGDLGRR
uniref:Uncharacterized protein n=1 Tax=Macaca nemestrina TaxID=9545 RepID=A0A2K6CRL7_MACNE